MATRSSRRERREFCQFSTALSSAFTEWLLILLLFVDTFCLYLLTKIFRCSESPTPCLVCSRFANLSGNEKLGFYNDSVCDVHKLEISSFAFCHLHKKLADAGGMCETCLLSFTKKNSSYREAYSYKHCSCCSQSANDKRPSANRLFEDEPILKELALPAGFDSQFLYRELKISSDSDSEVPFLGDDDDDGNSIVIEKLIHLDPDISDASSIPRSQPHEGGSCFNSFVESIDGLGHGLEEINWINVEVKPTPPLPSQITIIEEVEEVDDSRTISTPNVHEATWSLNITDIDPKPGKVMSEPDGNLPSGHEVEGEGSADCLKRQIEMDRNFKSNLYKELEEERNASAIAANQAMAMINKLQEEKAAMQLEVMQYLRMMEEQSEYEQEALQKLNDQLTEREGEVKDLEAELERYRRRCWDEYFAGMIARPSYDSDESEYSTTSTPHVLKNRGRGRSASGSIKESVLDFEDEREYISECLRRLEKNVRLFSSADASRYDEEDGDEFNEEVYAYDCKGEKRQNQSFHEENLCPEDWEPSIKENEKDEALDSFISGNNKHPKTSRRNNIIDLGDEVEHLHARLEALEADRDFLERAINSLRNGKDGIQFVQEIAAHLREIRRIGSTQREQESACNF